MTGGLWNTCVTLAVSLRGMWVYSAAACLLPSWGERPKKLIWDFLVNAFCNMYLVWIYKETSKTSFPSFDVWHLRKYEHNLFMLITRVFNLLNSKLCKYVSNSPALATTYIITPCMNNQTAKLAFEKLALIELGKKKGASVSRPDLLQHQLFKVWWWSKMT